MTNKEQAFEQLVRDHKRTIYTVCYMFSKNRSEVDDLFQEILIRLWLGFDTFEERSSVRTWVNRVAFNAAINQEKKQRHRVETIPLTVDIDPFDANDTSTQQIRQLYDRINQLDLIDRSLILLWLEGISYEEIGAIIGITPSNVGVRLLRIKDKLAKTMKNEE